MIMKTWNDYKEHVRTVDPEIGKDIDEVENIYSIYMIAFMLSKSK